MATFPLEVKIGELTSESLNPKMNDHVHVVSTRD